MTPIKNFGIENTAKCRGGLRRAWMRKFEAGDETWKADSQEWLRLERDAEDKQIADKMACEGMVSL